MSDTDSTIVTAAVLVIGNEILSGRTKDANLGYLAGELDKIGIRLREARVVPDVPEEIIGALNALRARYTYVFTTGGIGPTHDDITSACVAQAVGRELIRDPRAVAILEAHYPPGQLTEARLKMSEMPEGSDLVPNAVSAAPGYRTENVFVLAGVPSICRAMFDALKHTLVGGPPMLSRTVGCDLGEGRIAEDLGAIQERFPTVEIGSYPWFRGGQFGTSLVSRATDRQALDGAAEAIAAMIRAKGGNPVEESAA